MRPLKFLALMASFAMLVPAFLLAGCWDRLEPDVLGIISVAAFDLEPESGLFKVYVQLANPLGGSTQQQSGGGAGGGGGQGKSPIWALEATGRTIYEAFKNMEVISTRRLQWSHVEIILFSEKLAREGLRGVLDFIDREREIRLIARPFVVQGDLRRLLEAEFPLEQVGGTGISKQYFSVRRETSFTSDISSVREFFRHLSLPGLEAALPRLAVLEEKEMKKEGPSGTLNPARISGAAVFRGDKLVGFLDEKETAGYMWLEGKVQHHFLVLKCPGAEEDLLTVEIFEASARILPEIEDEKVRFKAFINAKGIVHDFTCADFPLEQEFIEALNRRLATAIRLEVNAALEKARELQADIFGLGNILYRTRNKDWKRLGDTWPELFPHVPVDVEVKASVVRHGHVLKPVQIR